MVQKLKSGHKKNTAIKINNDPLQIAESNKFNIVLKETNDKYAPTHKKMMSNIASQIIPEVSDSKLSNAQLRSVNSSQNMMSIKGSRSSSF